MKLLIAIDSSPSTESVINEVAARPWNEGTVARVLNVVDSRAVSTDFLDVDAFSKTEADAARALVESLADRLTSRGINSIGVVVEGYPRTKIVEYAREWGADFIFVGSHGHGSIARFFLGSIARAVTRTAPCSVGIVRSTGHRWTEGKAGMRILLATDGSQCSVAAARSIASRPWPEATEVRVVSAVDLVVPVIEPWYGAPELIGRIERETSKLAEKAVNSARQILSDAGIESSESILVGNPKVSILDEAKDWDADLIVVGSHGRRGIDRALQGSVSEAVAMHAHCSVEVIRERESLY
ncbi:MAG TPA: universal stress protein [Blastocatellia bacterium]|nr:universal stress protein [Blastocatellia bacterium]